LLQHLLEIALLADSGAPALWFQGFRGSGGGLAPEGAELAQDNVHQKCVLVLGEEDKGTMEEREEYRREHEGHIRASGVQLQGSQRCETCSKHGLDSSTRRPHFWTRSPQFTCTYPLGKVEACGRA
jgi:hypothetical protein